MNLVFFGTSDRSLPILEAIKDHGLVLCITKKDVLVGRKQELKETGVKKWAKENNLPYLEIDSLKSENLEKVLKELEDKKINTGLVCDFSYIIPKTIIDYFQNKLFNIHFSLLPKYRGASPVQAAILNGDEFTGITFQLVGEKLDEGDVAYQIEIPIAKDDTSGSLYNRMFIKAGEITSDFMQNFNSGKISFIKQDPNNATYTFSKTNPKSTQIYKEDACINWESSPESIERTIRAYNPWPIAWTYLKHLEMNPKMKDQIKLVDNLDKNQTVKILSAKLVDGLIKIETLQLESKNKTDWNSFKNGYIKR